MWLRFTRAGPRPPGDEAGASGATVGRPGRRRARSRRCGVVAVGAPEWGHVMARPCCTACNVRARSPLAGASRRDLAACDAGIQSLWRAAARERARAHSAVGAVHGGGERRQAAGNRAARPWPAELAVRARAFSSPSCGGHGVTGPRLGALGGLAPLPRWPFRFCRARAPRPTGLRTCEGASRQRSLSRC